MCRQVSVESCGDEGIFKTSCAVRRDIGVCPFPFRDGNSGRFSSTSPYRSRYQFTSSAIASRPSLFTGTARLTSLHLTIDLSKSRSVTGFLFWYTFLMRRLSNSLMRPPALTPIVNNPRLRISNVPDPRRISSLSRGVCLSLRCLQLSGFSVCIKKCTLLRKSRG